MSYIVIQFFSIVSFQMCPQIAWFKGSIIALVAFVSLFSNVHFQMFPQTARVSGCIITKAAMIWLFSAVDFHMCHQCGCLRENFIAQVALFLTFQSLDPSLVQISKRKERDNCSIWTRLMYIFNWPLVLSPSPWKQFYVFLATAPTGVLTVGTAGPPRFDWRPQGVA